MNPASRRQAAVLTLAAAALLAGLHWLPADTTLTHMDFVPGGAAAEFCDPANPRFLAVLAQPSPLVLALAADPAALAGQPTTVILTLRSASGRLVGLADLLPTAGQNLHLHLVDPALATYQHIVPMSEGKRGEWRFAFTPRGNGVYRVFVDATPRATGQEVYASADLAVAGEIATRLPAPDHSFEAEGDRFILRPSASPIYARQPIALTLDIERPGGGVIPLIPEDGAFAHLTAFDQARTGFVDLRPPRDQPDRPPNPFHPSREFKVTFSQPGHYIIWCRVNLGGKEVTGPFALDVIP